VQFVAILSTLGLLEVLELETVENDDFLIAIWFFHRNIIRPKLKHEKEVKNQFKSQITDDTGLR
jgi:hypothetical protein